MSVHQREISNPLYWLKRIYSGNMRHWTPRYVLDRVRLELEYRRNPTDPWLTRDAIQLLDQLLRPIDVGFEWGSGRSTMWFVNRTSFLTSIENDQQWYARVSTVLSQHNATNIDYQWHSTEALELETAMQSSYVQAISVFDADSLDYIVVDGWARDWCANQAVSKLKRGGIMILDNANWFIPPPQLRSPATVQHTPVNAQWEDFCQRAQDWRKIWTSNGVTDTLLLIKT
jgi:predicted O-methyltransferase YrrM